MTLEIYYGKSGEWKRVVSVPTVAGAENYLKDKRFHSAALSLPGKFRPFREWETFVISRKVEPL